MAFNGVLVVEIIEAHGLSGANTSCQITVGGSQGGDWKPIKEFTTQTAQHSQDPIWAEEFSVKVTSHEVRLVVTVQEQKRKNNVALGEVDTVITPNQKWGEKGTLALTQNSKSAGTVTLILHYYAGEDEAPKLDNTAELRKEIWTLRREQEAQNRSWQEKYKTLEAANASLKTQLDQALHGTGFLKGKLAAMQAVHKQQLEAMSALEAELGKLGEGLKQSKPCSRICTNAEPCGTSTGCSIAKTKCSCTTTATTKSKSSKSSTSCWSGTS